MQRRNFVVIKQSRLFTISDTTDTEREIISKIINSTYELSKFNAKTPILYIEIGTSWGKTFKYILEHCPDVWAIGIDLFEKELVDEYDKKNPSHYLIESNLSPRFFNFELLKGKSQEVIPNLDITRWRTIVCFIDGDHSYKGCMEDFLCLNAKINHGYFIFHDTSLAGQWGRDMFNKDGGPRKVVDDILNDYKDSIVLIDEPENMSILYKDEV